MHFSTAFFTFYFILSVFATRFHCLSNVLSPLETSISSDSFVSGVFLAITSQSVCPYFLAFSSAPDFGFSISTAFFSDSAFSPTTTALDCFRFYRFADQYHLQGGFHAFPKSVFTSLSLDWLGFTGIAAITAH